MRTTIIIHMLLTVLLLLGCPPDEDDDAADDDTGDDDTGDDDTSDDDTGDDDTGDDDTGDDDFEPTEVTITELHLDAYNWAFEGAWEATFPYTPIPLKDALTVAEDYYALEIQGYGLPCDLEWEQDGILSCGRPPTDYGGRALVDMLSGEVLYGGVYVYAARGQNPLIVFPKKLTEVDRAEFEPVGTRLPTNTSHIISDADTGWLCAGEPVAEWVLQSAYLHDRFANQVIDIWVVLMPYGTELDPWSMDWAVFVRSVGEPGPPPEKVAPVAVPLQVRSSRPGDGAAAVPLTTTPVVHLNQSIQDAATIDVWVDGPNGTITTTCSLDGPGTTLSCQLASPLITDADHTLQVDLDKNGQPEHGAAFTTVQSDGLTFDLREQLELTSLGEDPQLLLDFEVDTSLMPPLLLHLEGLDANDTFPLSVDGRIGLGVDVSPGIVSLDPAFGYVSGSQGEQILAGSGFFDINLDVLPMPMTHNGAAATIDLTSAYFSGMVKDDGNITFIDHGFVYGNTTIEELLELANEMGATQPVVDRIAALLPWVDLTGTCEPTYVRVTFVADPIVVDLQP